MKKLFSPGAILKKLSHTLCRFPLAVAALAALVVLAYLSAHDICEDIDYRWPLWLVFTLTSSIATTLAFEDRRSRSICLLAGLGLSVLWGVRCLLLPADDDDMSTVQIVEMAVVQPASFLAIFCAAFLRRGTDARWWNFTMRLLVRLLLGAAFSVIFFVGLWMAIFAVEVLFDVDLPGGIFADLSILCFLLFAPLYVMAGVPEGEAKNDPELHPAPAAKVLGLYIFGPILAIYTLILYVYLLKIIVQWELPDGWVSWLVTTLGLGGLAVTLLLYPHRMRGGNRVVDFLGRWMGVIIAPLLMLMTVGIARRISDYGFTPNRAYILLLNLWFYGVYIWLFVVKGRRVKWIHLSAIVVALLSSVGPWSLAGITPGEKQAEVEEDGVIVVEEEPTGSWFSSDSLVMDNVDYPLAGKYGKFAKVEWDDDVRAGNMEFTKGDNELVISIPKGGNAAPASGERGFDEFRIPLRQMVNERIVYGPGFAFLVEWYSGMQYDDRVDVYLLQGYLLYN